MNIIVDIFSQYYGIIIVSALIIVYGVTHREVSLNYAKKMALQFIFLAEKKAEEYLLTEGKKKKEWVILNGYDVLPMQIRIFVSKKLFEIIVQEVFNTAIKYVENRKK